MTAVFYRWNEWLGKRMFLLVLSAMAMGFYLKAPDTPTLRAAVIAFFAYMTFITALSTSFRQFVKVLRRPAAPLWILVLVHGVTPLVAWLAGIIFYPTDLYIRMGYLVGASIPIGVTSLIWTSLVKGNSSVSLVAITLDTLITPVFLPLFFKAFIGQTVQIDYLKMVLELLAMITLPSLIGMILHDWSEGRLAGFAKGIGGFTSKLAFFGVIFINALLVLSELTFDLSLVKALLVTLGVSASGYFIGYLGSFALRERSPEMIMTMIYNVGMRNISTGLVLALAYFPPAAAIPIITSMLYQQPLAAIIPHIYKPAAAAARPGR